MESKELIVGFRRGVEEADARKIVEATGASVKRRMRTDHADEVMFLVLTHDPKTVEKVMKKNADVTHTEINQGGFKIS